MATTSPSLPESLPPHELRNYLQSTLNLTLKHMDSDEFQMELEELSEAERRAADVTRGETYRTWRRLTNQQLDEIRNELVAHERELTEATRCLRDSLENVAKAATVMNSTNQVLAVVSRLFTLV